MHADQRGFERLGLVGHYGPGISGGGDDIPDPLPEGGVDGAEPAIRDRLIPGHGPVHRDRARMQQMRNYIQELTGIVEDAKKAGKPLPELQKTITPTSLKTLQADGYGDYVADNLAKFTIYLGQKTPLEDRLAGNIEAIFNNLDRV